MNSVYFSVIIPTYNRALLLEKCIRSVISQSYSSFEIIVVDNYSDDNTEEIVLSFKDNRIKYYKIHNNGIISISRNYGIEKASGEWICFLDSDDCWLNNKLDVIYPYTKRYDLIYHQYRLNIRRSYPFQRLRSNFYSVEGKDIAYVLMRGDPINPSCSAISKAALGSIRFSEEKNFFAVEDYDFFLQIILKNVKTKLIDKDLTLYDVTTGCSHGRVALDRDRVIFNKYKKYLNHDQFREVIKYYYYRKACYFFENKLYNDAKRCFLIAYFSKAICVKKNSLLGVVKSMLFSFVNIKK